MTSNTATSAITVRRVGPLDAAAIAAIHAASFVRGWDAASMAQFLASPSCLCLVASLAAGEPAQGFLIARTAGDEAELITLAVHPACRRQGLGKALLRAATSALRAAGTRKLFLEVEEANTQAQSLYASEGALPVGQRKAYYEHGADARIFCLAL